MNKEKFRQFLTAVSEKGGRRKRMEKKAEKDLTEMSLREIATKTVEVLHDLRNNFLILEFCLQRMKKELKEG